MRVSFESGLEITSLCAGSAPNSSRQQPVWPLNSSVVVSLMQKPCGVSVVASEPEPGCCCFGGTAYWLTVSTLLLRLSAGDAVFSDDVFVSAQVTSWVEVRAPAAPDTGWVASSAAFELRKYSVPPALESKEAVPGDWAGQTVKPGCVDPAALGTLTAPNVSMCVMMTDAAPAASCAFEKA